MPWNVIYVLLNVNLTHIYRQRLFYYPLLSENYVIRISITENLWLLIKMTINFSFETFFHIFVKISYFETKQKVMENVSQSWVIIKNIILNGLYSIHKKYFGVVLQITWDILLI